MKGFTLIETLVAITIVLLAVLGPFELVKQSLTASYVARDQLVANALAEEGLEHVRWLRDDNYLRMSATPNTPDLTWLSGLDGTPYWGSTANCFTANGCFVQALDGDGFEGGVMSAYGQALPCATDCPLLWRDQEGVYTHWTNGGGNQLTPTPFRRRVRLEQVDGSQDTVVKVIVTVTFESAHTPFTVTVEDYLYNWL